MREVFEHKTPARPAAVARPITEPGRAEDPDAGVGAVPLTPITRWRQERPAGIRGFNQAQLVVVPPDADEDRLCSALRILLDHHGITSAPGSP